MDQQTLMLVGAFGGAALGVLGGLVGTYFSIRNTNGPCERRFVLWAAIFCLLTVAAFVVALLAIPTPYNSLLRLPYMAALPFAARAWNRKQMQIRGEESARTAE